MLYFNACGRQYKREKYLVGVELPAKPWRKEARLPQIFGSSTGRVRYAEAVNFIDVSACDALGSLIQELRSQGITFAVARVRDNIRERMRLGGVEAVVGPTNFYERLTDGVRAWQEQEAPDGASSGTI